MSGTQKQLPHQTILRLAPMEDEISACKRHFDITMSKRTRKPLHLNQSVRVQPEKCEEPPLKSFLDQEGTGYPDLGQDPAAKCEEPPPKSFREKQGNDELESRGVLEEEDEGDLRSLKELINDDGGAGDQQNARGVRSSLGHHFTEEKQQLQLVKKPQYQDGFKLKGIVSRYVKVLSHLVKVRHEPRARLGSRKKHLLHLTT